MVAALVLQFFGFLISAGWYVAKNDYLNDLQNQRIRSLEEWAKEANNTVVQVNERLARIEERTGNQVLLLNEIKQKLN